MKKQTKKFIFDVKKLDSNYNFKVYNSSTVSNPEDNSIIFLKKNSKELLDNLEKVKNCILILLDTINGKIFEKENVVIYVKNPRYIYARLLSKILEDNKKESNLFFKDGYCYGENVEIGKNVMIEPFVKIGNDVSIGDNTIIRSGVKIGDNVSIGKNCYIRENSVIGGEGFGIEKDENGNNFRIPHIGGVRIEDNVEIGALNTICSGTIEPTIVESFVKTDDHVHIGHNDFIKSNVCITAGAIISGSVEISENTYIAPNSSIRNGIKIGRNVTLGMAARVLKSVEDNQVLTNERADTLENVVKFNKYKQEILRKFREKK